MTQSKNEKLGFIEMFFGESTSLDAASNGQVIIGKDCVTARQKVKAITFD